MIIDEKLNKMASIELETVMSDVHMYSKYQLS